MRIDDERDAFVKFMDIDTGECFVWEGRTHIKLSTLFQQTDGTYVTCVCLDDGEPRALGYATPVEPVNARVVIE